MKTKLSFILFLLITHLSLLNSQTPQGFNYQAVARDASGTSIVNTPLPVRITIQADSLGTTILWQELHPGVVSNSLGMISLVVGKGARQTSSTLASFADIDWSVSPKFIKTEIDNSGWKTMGVTRLWSVPYSLVAEELAGSVKKLTVSGETENMEEALFEVKNKTGQTVFAVYNEGVRVYVSDGDAKGLKGGFAVGGFGTDKAESTKYMFVDKDSVRIYLDTNPLTKGVKGGFAVGGYDLTKGTTEEFLRVTRDSTRIYVNEDASVKGVKGGFAVGGFDATKGSITPFTSLTPLNYFIGHESGQSLDGGVYNSVLGYQGGRSITSGTGNLFLGYQSGYSTTKGDFNTFVGYRSGFGTTGDYSGHNTFIGSYSGENTTGDGNTFIGFGSGQSNIYGNYNVCIGYNAGLSGTNATSNVFIGYESGKAVSDGYSNIFIGEFSGQKTTGGRQNVFIGDEAGRNNLTGNLNVLIGTGAGQKLNSSDNILIGFGSGFDLTSGNNNLFIGQQSGFNNQTGTGNIFIGNGSGYSETGSNKLYIDNSITTAPLIYGDFNSNYLTFNGSVNVTGNTSISGSATISGAATVSGNASFSGTYLRITNSPGSGTTPTNYAYQGAAGSTSKSLAFSVNDALWVTGPTFMDKYLDIDVSGSGALSVAGMEALWFNGTYFSWGYGSTYNYFAKKMVIGGSPINSGYALYVAGSAYTTGSWAGSDSRWKKDIDPLQNTLPALLSLNPVKYNWRKEEFPEMSFDEGSQLGLIAQEVEKIFPELVSTDDNGYKAVSYEKLTVVLLEGMKEQQKQIESQNLKIEQLYGLIEKLQEK